MTPFTQFKVEVKNKKRLPQHDYIIQNTVKHTDYNEDEAVHLRFVYSQEKLLALHRNPSANCICLGQLVFLFRPCSIGKLQEEFKEIGNKKHSTQQ